MIIFNILCQIWTFSSQWFKKIKKDVFYCWVSVRESIGHQKCSFFNIVIKSFATFALPPPLPPQPPGVKKNLTISEFSLSCLFDKIEWEPPQKTDKLLWVMKKTGKAVLGHFQLNSTGLEYARIEWGGSHSILATDGIQNFWVPPFFQD